MRIPDFVFGLLLLGATATAAAAFTPAEQTTIDAYDRVAGSVVMIACRAVAPQDGTEYMVTGSGFVLENNHVVTDFHVIENAVEITVVTQGREPYRAVVVGTAPYFDVALLRLPPEAPALAPAPLGSTASLRLGQAILAIGSPFGTEISVTAGIVSGLGREFTTNDVERRLIQFDAPVNPGQSGGPLIDSSGRVVGVIIAKARDGEAMGFATPIDRVLTMVPDLVRMGHPFQAEIGVQGIDVTDELDALFAIGLRSGFLIERVEPNSAAEQAGLASGHRVVEMGDRVHVLGGDIIVAANDVPISGGRDLARLLLALTADAEVRFQVMRRGVERTVTLTIPPMSHWGAPEHRGH